MTAVTLEDKINLSHAKTLRRSREQLKVTRIECKMMAKTGQGNDNENRPKISAKIVRHYIS